jgi:gliding motility-associated lipoprotein GldH
MKNRRFYIFSLVIGIFLAIGSGCTSEKVYDPLSKMDLAEGWSYGDSLVFSEVNWKDRRDRQTLKLRITISDSFQYENIYLRGDFGAVNDSLAVRIFSVQLADKFGNWLGKCNSSECTIDYELSEFLLPFEDQTTISISQWTRDSILVGVSELQLVWSEQN